MTKIVAPLKNGPKGICDLMVFLPMIIKPTPTIAPLIKAKNKAKQILGQPRIKPIKAANLTSPKPIHLPLEIRTKERKKPLAKTADKIFDQLKIKASKIAGKIILSGMM